MIYFLCLNCRFIGCSLTTAYNDRLNAWKTKTVNGVIGSFLQIVSLLENFGQYIKFGFFLFILLKVTVLRMGEENQDLDLAILTALLRGIICMTLFLALKL